MPPTGSASQRLRSPATSSCIESPTTFGSGEATCCARIARGEWEAAIELYFGLVGKRWDKEWLVTAVAATDGRRSVAGVLGEVVVPEALRESSRERDMPEREPGITLARAL